MPRSCNILLFFVFGYPQSMVERYCFHQIFLNCGSCFLARHLHSHCCLCPKFLSPHAFGAFLHPVLTCLAIPLYIQLRQAAPSRRRPSYLIFNAAFWSRSWAAPQCGHVHLRIFRFFTSELMHPQQLHVWDDGYHLSTF